MSKNRKPTQHNAGSQPENQGEGDRRSAERFNDAQRQFVKSERGQEEIRHAGDLGGAAKREAEAAERQGKARAKDEDPAVTRRPAGASDAKQDGN